MSSLRIWWRIASLVEFVHEIDDVAQSCSARGACRQSWSIARGGRRWREVAPRRSAACGQSAEPVLVERSGQHRVRRQGPPLPVGKALGLGPRPRADAAWSSISLVSLSCSATNWSSDRLSPAKNSNHSPTGRQSPRPIPPGFFRDAAASWFLTLFRQDRGLERAGVGWNGAIFLAAFRLILPPWARMPSSKPSMSSARGPAFQVRFVRRLRAVDSSIGRGPHSPPAGSPDSGRRSDRARSRLRRPTWRPRPCWRGVFFASSIVLVHVLADCFVQGVDLAASR